MENYGLFKDQFNLVAGEPLVWYLKAESLWRAGLLLNHQAVADVQQERLGAEPKPSLEGVAMLLIGFAIENMLKALLIKQGGAFDNSGKFRHRTHSMARMFCESGITLDEEEKRFLERLEACVLWAGRYPVPLEYKDMLPRPIPGGGKAPLSCALQTVDKETLNRVFDKLQAALQIKITTNVERD